MNWRRGSWEWGNSTRHSSVFVYAACSFVTVFMEFNSSSEGFVLSDALWRAMQLYVANWRLFLSISLAGAALNLVQTYLGGSDSLILKGMGYILSPLAFGFGLLFYMALILAIAKRQWGEEISFEGAVQDVFFKFWRAVGAGLVFSLITIFGFLLLIIPGIYWMTILYFFMFFIVLENKRLWDAFESSASLVKGRFWKVLGAQTIILLIVVALFLPFFFGMWLMGLPVVLRNIFLQIAAVLLAPFFVACYYQLFVWLKGSKAEAGHIAVYEKT